MIYRTRFGDEYDLATWPRDHQEFIEQAYRFYLLNPPYSDFVERILGSRSPVLDLKRNGPKPTRTPLYEVATDLEFRLGVKQGHYSKDWDGPIDPDWPSNSELEGDPS